MNRLFDLLGALAGLVLLSPLFCAVAVVIRLDDGGPVFYRQLRVGRNRNPFWILKFRTMARDADQQGPALTVGQDPRVTRAGKWLRAWKVDELPQLVNVLLGEMSLVGPRPEVPHYVAFYTQDQAAVLGLTPGITDPASIAYRRESEVLSLCEDPENFYIQTVMPDKIRINLEYAAQATVWSNFKIILATLGLCRPPPAAAQIPPGQDPTTEKKIG